MSQRLISLAVALFVLSTLLHVSSAMGQKDETVHPLFHAGAAASSGNAGFSPAQIRSAYGFDQIRNQGLRQVIAIVNPFDHPNIEDDLRIFSEAFGLPACTTGNGCFQKIYASTQPATDPIWAFETAIDVEWAHAIAPQAKIILVETATALLSDLLQAIDLVLDEPYNATIVSMSWGLNEFKEELSHDGHFLRRNVTFLAGSGDAGHGTLYPAASPYVVGVGGTKLQVDNVGNYQSERVWSDSGGGMSLYEPALPFQIPFLLPGNSQKRGIPDVAYVADPKTGVIIYNSIPLGGESGWLSAGGTSVGAPQWAGLVAIANSKRAEIGKQPLTGYDGFLYDAVNANSPNYNDIVKGQSGSCHEECSAGPGYDYVTGLGTPRANDLIPRLTELP
jgi:subtilase family serine protease